MDKLHVLGELFPRIDARLIKATVLDGDDMESAVKFLLSVGSRGDSKSFKSADDSEETIVWKGGQRPPVSKAYLEQCFEDPGLASYSTKNLKVPPSDCVEETENEAIECRKHESVVGRADDLDVSPRLKLDGNFLERKLIESHNSADDHPIAVDTFGDATWDFKKHNVTFEELEMLMSDTSSWKETLKGEIANLNALRLAIEEEEAAAQRAKLEAVDAGLDIEEQVAQLRQQVAHDKELFEMRASEIYGDNAILSKEAGEVCCRLLETQSQQGLALCVISKLNSNLQVRLQKASEERFLALREKEDKLRAARELLSMEEVNLNEIARDLSGLQAEADKCMKLRESIVDYGNMIDTLQGEMTVLFDEVATLSGLVEIGAHIQPVKHQSSDSFTGSVGGTSQEKCKSVFNASVHSTLELEEANTCRQQTMSSQRTKNAETFDPLSILQVGDSISCDGAKEEIETTSSSSSSVELEDGGWYCVGRREIFPSFKI